MKKHLVSIVALIAIAGGSVSPALADEGGGIRGFFQKFRAQRQENRDKQQNTRPDWQNFRDELASRSQELRLKLIQKRDQDRIRRLMSFWDKAVGRLQNLIDRESGMSHRIAERLAKFKAAGKDVHEQEVLLGKADEAIAAAQSSLDAAVVTLKQMVTDGKPVADIIAAARQLHAQVVGKIRAGHAALVDVIVSTRGMSLTPTPVPSASPTP